LENEPNLPLIICWVLLFCTVTAYILFSAARAAWLASGVILIRRLREDMEERDDRRGASILRQPDHVLLSLQLGQQVSLVVLSCLLAAGMTTGMINWPTLILAAIAVLLTVYLVDFLLLPTLAAIRPELMLRLAMPFIRLSYILLYIPAQLANGLQNRFPREDNEEEPSEDDVEAYIDVGEEEGILEKEEGILLRSIVDFGDTVVSEVMTPRTDMVCLDEDSAITELRDLFVNEKHSRIPVYREKTDQIIGVAYARDLLGVWKDGKSEQSLSAILRQPLFVPETKKISELMTEFQSNRVQLALVVDEYGGTAGLVTLEDLLEEIVGEIQDEYDEEEPLLMEEEDGTKLASAMLSVDDFQNRFGVEVQGEEFETLGGLVIAELGHLPKVGETLEYQGVDISVVEADERRIYRLRIRTKKDKSDIDSPGE